MVCMYVECGGRGVSKHPPTAFLNPIEGGLGMEGLDYDQHGKHAQGKWGMVD